MVFHQCEFFRDFSMYLILSICSHNVCRWMVFHQCVSICVYSRYLFVRIFCHSRCSQMFSYFYPWPFYTFLVCVYVYNCNYLVYYDAWIYLVIGKYRNKSLLFAKKKPHFAIFRIHYLNGRDSRIWGPGTGPPRCWIQRRPRRFQLHLTTCMGWALTKQISNQIWDM